jgi:hypothetical protein
LGFDAAANGFACVRSICFNVGLHHDPDLVFALSRISAAAATAAKSA